MSEQTYTVRRFQGENVLAEVTGTHAQITGIVLMVWGVVPDTLAADPEDPLKEGEWKMHLGGADWMVVTR